MSKSLGNVVDPAELAANASASMPCATTSLRDITTGKDSAFDLERLVMLFNTELANDLGNLLNRSLNMTKRFLGGCLRVTDYENEETQSLRQSLAAAASRYQEAMEAYDISGALAAINAHVVHCNGFAERNKPWELAKDEAQADRLAAVLHHLCESCAHLSVLLEPVLPDAAAKIRSQLRLDTPLTLPDLKWGLLPRRPRDRQTKARLPPHRRGGGVMP